jgi:katanin p60 ATPase-containing subunit A1
LVPLPDAEAREAMFRSLLPNVETELPYDLMVELTDGYSGSDIRIVCKEAAMRPLRRLMTELEEIEKVEEAKNNENSTASDEGISTRLRTFQPLGTLILPHFKTKCMASDC